MKKHQFSLVLAVSAALLAATPAFAFTWTWNGSQPNDHWTSNFNWTPTGPPANDGTANVIFAGTTRLTPDMNANWNVNSLSFNNTAGAFNLQSSTASTLTIGAGGITNNSTHQETTFNQIMLSAAQTWNAASGDLVIYNSFDVNNGGNLLTIDAAAGRRVYLDGLISGSGGLTKNGLGTLSLDGGFSNTYAGKTTVNAGTLYLNNSFFEGPNTIPGSLDIGDAVGTAIDTVACLGVSNEIADSASVSVFSTGFWDLASGYNETITNLNIVSTGVAGGGLVTFENGTLTILGSVTMTGGTVNTSGTGKLLINGNLTTSAAGITASISSQLDLGNGTRTFTIADGAVLNDLDISGVVSNGEIIKEGPGTLRLGAANTYAGGTTLNAGTILIGNDSALGTGPLTGNGGTLQPDGAARTIANAVSGNFAVDGAFDLTLNSPLNLSGNITKNSTGTLIFAQAATFDALTVNAGTARLDAAVTFASGLTNSATLLLGTQTLTVNGAGLDNEGSLPLAGATLAGSGPVVNNGLIAGTGTISGSGGFTNNAQLTVSGGNVTLSNAGANVNTGNIDISAGLQLRLTGGNLANSGWVNLIGGNVNGTATLNNNAGGLIRGDGKVANTVNNNTGGQLRAEPGKSLTLTGSGNTNSGQINLYGGLLEFTQNLTNNPGGFISGNGTLIVDNGLTNNGTMNFSGLANVVGNTTNSVGAKIISSGGGPTTFFDDVTNQGEIRTSAGSFTVFFGSVSGAGTFTGLGTVNFEGDLKPGNSPATIQFAGDVALGSHATLQIEIGGTTPGSQYDQVHVTGQLALDGTLKVSLVNFNPSSGQLFDILDWGSLSGTFAALQLPTLAGGLQWNTSQLSTAGVLSISLPGDFNANTKVDSADYVTWRKNNGSPTDYTTWRENFGQTAGSGAGVAASAAVPEPATTGMLILAAGSWCLRRRRAA